MFSNYLIIAFRRLIRHKIYSFINILGLAVGIAFCLLLFLFIRHEWTYDRFHKDSDHIFRVIHLGRATTGESFMLTIMPETLGPLLKAEFPQLTQVVRVRDGKKEKIGIGERQHTERLLFVDADFLKLFSFPLRQGDRESALEDPGAIVLSESVAQRCFGDTNPMGKDVRIATSYWQNEPRIFTVRGIIADPPSNSSIQFGALLPYSTLPPLKAFSLMPDSPMNDASRLNFWAPKDYVFVRLRDQAHVEDVNQGLVEFVKVHKVSAQREVSLQLQPLREIHFDRRPTFMPLEPPGNPSYAYILAGIALSVLLIACVNFTNLSIAQFSTRAREVGVRKMVGAQRGQLMLQFWGESLAVTALALILGFALAELCLPTFNGLTRVPLAMDYVPSWSSVLFISGLLMLVGLTSGTYPAVVLSGFEPITFFKDRLQLSGNGMVQRALVVLQFAASIILVITTAAMFGQIAFLKTKNLGFLGDQVVVISTNGLQTTGDVEAQRTKRAHIFSTYRQALESYSGIVGVTRSNLFSNMDADDQLNEVPVRLPNDAEVRIPYIDVESDFLGMLGIRLLAGRTFSESAGAAAQSTILVNETLVKQFGLEEPLGFQVPLRRQIAIGTDIRNMKMQMIRNPEIIGVVRDFHIRSLHDTVPPLVIFLRPESLSGEFLVRIHPERTAETLVFLAETWREIIGDAPFNYVFLDERFDRLYHSEERWQTIVGYASLFALFVACLGVFGLTAITVARRTREFGIRKALGATTRHIFALLSKEFMILILIANAIAWPLAYYAVDRWLQDFAYRIDLGIGLFVLSGSLVLMTALLTVGLQALHAARRNPVDALRYE